MSSLEVAASDAKSQRVGERVADAVWAANKRSDVSARLADEPAWQGWDVVRRNGLACGGRVSWFSVKWDFRDWTLASSKIGR
jgi:hypothetical protein